MPVGRRRFYSRGMQPRAKNSLDLSALIDSVERNCAISDARHAGDYTLCTYLLKMREFYRWEQEIPYFAEVPQADLGAWLTARERRWDDLEEEPFGALPLASGIDPFDSAVANRYLVPQGFVYSGGYGRLRKPLFFLGRLLHAERRDGFELLISSCEYARELAAPPAMLQGHTIYVRQESARRFVWEKVDEWRWNRQDNAMGRALAYFDFDRDPQAALEAMTTMAMDVMVQHELGEGLVGHALGEGWASLLAGLSRSRAEIVARAVRDHLADCRSTVPFLLAADDPAAIHFYFANIDGVRRLLFPAFFAAYTQFAATRELAPLQRAIEADKAEWLGRAQAVVRSFAADPARAARELEAALPAETCNTRRQ